MTKPGGLEMTDRIWLKSYPPGVPADIDRRNTARWCS